MTTKYIFRSAKGRSRFIQILDLKLNPINFFVVCSHKCFETTHLILVFKMYANCHLNMIFKQYTILKFGPRMLRYSDLSHAKVIIFEKLDVKLYPN